MRVGFDTSNIGNQKDINVSSNTHYNSVFKNDSGVVTSGFELMQRADNSQNNGAGASEPSYIIQSSGFVNINKNHFGLASFKSMTRAERKSRSRVILAALPKGAEGEVSISKIH